MCFVDFLELREAEDTSIIVHYLNYIIYFRTGNSVINIQHELICEMLLYVLMAINRFLSRLVEMV